jgi:hypothetical protein
MLFAKPSFSTATLDLEDRCKAELDLLSGIEKAAVDSRVRCKLVLDIINGVPLPSIEEELKKESK